MWCVKVPSRASKTLLMVWLVSCITIILYYYQNSAPIENAVVAVVSSFFSSSVLIYLLYSLDKYKLEARLSFGYILVAISVLYNHNSLTKYVVDSLFDGYISSLYLRLLGSILVDLIIFSAIMLLNRRYSKLQNSYKYEASFINIQLPFILILIFIVMIADYSVLQMPIKNRLLDTGDRLLRCIACSLVVVYAKNNERSGFIKKYFPIIALTIWYVFLTSITGSKSLIVLYAFVIAIALYYLDMVGLKTLTLGFAMSPFVIRGISSISELISGRMNVFSSEWVLRYHSFRYDLSDLAVTILGEPSSLKYSMDIVTDAIKFAMPSSLVNLDKDSLLNGGAYRSQMQLIGLQPYDDWGFPEDFNDTLFSVGAQIGGLVGMVLFFIFVVLVFDSFSSYIKKKKLGYEIIIAMIGMVALVECDMFSFVNNIRDLIIVYMVVSVFYFVMRKFRRKRSFVV